MADVKVDIAKLRYCIEHRHDSMLAFSTLQMHATLSLKALLDRIDLLEGIGRDLASIDPVVDDANGLYGCMICGRAALNVGNGPEVKHEASCAWIRARAAMGGGK